MKVITHSVSVIALTAAVGCGTQQRQPESGTVPQKDQPVAMKTIEADPVHDAALEAEFWQVASFAAVGSASSGFEAFDIVCESEKDASGSSYTVEIKFKSETGVRSAPSLYDLSIFRATLENDTKSLLLQDLEVQQTYGTGGLHFSAYANRGRSQLVDFYVYSLGALRVGSMSATLYLAELGIPKNVIGSLNGGKYTCSMRKLDL